MSARNYCRDGGYLVAPEYPVATESTEFYAEGALVILGCGNLRCSKCGQSVRNREDEGTRHYECACLYWDEPGVQPLSDLEGGNDALAPAPPQSWSCDGHGVLSFPCELAGVTLPPDEGWLGLVRRSFSGWAPSSLREPERRRPWSWPATLYLRLTQTKEGESLSRAAAECLTDGDLRTRAAAIGFFHCLPVAPGGERIVQLAEGDRSPFVDIVNPIPSASKLDGDPETLEESLLRVVACRALKIGDAASLELLKRELLTKGKGRSVVTVVAQLDLEWLVEHGEQILAASPMNAHELLLSSMSSDRWVEMVVGMVKDGTLSEKALRAFCEPRSYSATVKELQERLTR